MFGAIPQRFVKSVKLSTIGGFEEGRSARQMHGAIDKRIKSLQKANESSLNFTFCIWTQSLWAWTKYELGIFRMVRHRFGAGRRSMPA
jgi:hypothetical protein